MDGTPVALSASRCGFRPLLLRMAIGMTSDRTGHVQKNRTRSATAWCQPRLPLHELPLNLQCLNCLPDSHRRSSFLTASSSWLRRCWAASSSSISTPSCPRRSLIGASLLNCDITAVRPSPSAARTTCALEVTAAQLTSDGGQEGQDGLKDESMKRQGPGDIRGKAHAPGWKQQDRRRSSRRASHRVLALQGQHEAQPSSGTLEGQTVQTLQPAQAANVHLGQAEGAAGEPLELEEEEALQKRAIAKARRQHAARRRWLLWRLQAGRITEREYAATLVQYKCMFDEELEKAQHLGQKVWVAEQEEQRSDKGSNVKVSRSVGKTKKSTGRPTGEIKQESARPTGKSKNLAPGSTDSRKQQAMGTPQVDSEASSGKASSVASGRSMIKADGTSPASAASPSPKGRRAAPRESIPSADVSSAGPDPGDTTVRSSKVRRTTLLAAAQAKRASYSSKQAAAGGRTEGTVQGKQHRGQKNAALVGAEEAEPGKKRRGRPRKDAALVGTQEEPKRSLGAREKEPPTAQVTDKRHIIGGPGGQQQERRRATGRGVRRKEGSQDSRGRLQPGKRVQLMRSIITRMQVQIQFLQDSMASVPVGELDREHYDVRLQQYTEVIRKAEAGMRLYQQQQQQ